MAREEAYLEHSEEAHEILLQIWNATMLLGISKFATVELSLHRSACEKCTRARMSRVGFELAPLFPFHCLIASLSNCATAKTSSNRHTIESNFSTTVRFMPNKALIKSFIYSINKKIFGTFFCQVCRTYLFLRLRLLASSQL